MNNKGLSLVELVVAMAVGSIIAGSIAFLIVTSTRMYSKENANIEGQYEIQTTLNQTVDSAESAQWFALSQDTLSGSIVNTKYIAFGKLFKNPSDSKILFAGEIFTDDYSSRDSNGRFNVYMNRYTALDVTSEASAYSAVSGEADTIRGDAKYLLGQGATKYIVTPDNVSARFINTNPSDEDYKAGFAGYYKNPIVFNVEIDFLKESMSGFVNKHSEDKVTFRNRIDRTLFIGTNGYYLLED